MTDLDSTAWKTLSHAYGSADDVPDLLKNAETVESTCTSEDEPWLTLWSSLCHQGDVYSASIAAVPHFKKKVGKVRLTEDVLEPIPLLSGIVVATERCGLPKGCSEDQIKLYREVVERLPELIIELLRRTADPIDARYEIATLLVATGHTVLGGQLHDSDEYLECPECDAVFPRYYDVDDTYSHHDEQKKSQSGKDRD